MQEIVHRREYICIIGSGCYDELAHTECIFNSFCHIVTAQISDRNLWSALGTKDFRHFFGCFLGASMDRGVCNEYTFCFYFVLAPCVVQTNVITQVFLQDRTVKRTDASDVQSSSFLQECLYLCAIFTANVKVITASFACPVFFVSQCTELAETIGREQYLIGCIVSDHHFRPMHHWSHEELQFPTAQVESVAFLYRNRTTFETSVFEELRHHLDSLSRCNYL